MMELNIVQTNSKTNEPMNRKCTQHSGLIQVFKHMIHVSDLAGDCIVVLWLMQFFVGKKLLSNGIGFFFIRKMRLAAMETNSGLQDILTTVLAFLLNNIIVKSGFLTEFEVNSSTFMMLQ